MRIGCSLLLALAFLGCAGRPPLAPEPGAPSVELADARAGTGYAQVVWQVRNGAGLSFVVQRRHADQPWKMRATLVPDAGGRMMLEDGAVLAGEPYSYGVLIPGRARDEVHAVVTLEIPGAPDPEP